MTANVGTVDRIIRLVIGLALILAPFVTNWALVQSTTGTILSVVVGLILAGTSMMKFCPLYRILGLRTCKV